MAKVINSFAINGINAYVVKIEVDTIFGQPSVSVVGLADISVKESRERLETGIINQKYEFPKMKIIFNLAPSDIKKSGSHFDLGMAIGLLIQDRQILVDNIENFAFIGELSLNGELRACSGVLPMAIEAKEKGIRNLIVPKENFTEASLVKDINVFAFDNLKEVVTFLIDQTIYNEIQPEKYQRIDANILDFEDVQGQDSVLDFIVAAAAGGHNIMLSGLPGCGKSMIAKRIPTILPSMSEEESLEVTKVYSVAGLLKNKGSLITERPFRSPHHNASMNSLVGGGNFAKPGEISLSHNGVLFLDEISEFNKKSLEALRQPLEDNVITISRVKGTQTYPANFMLVGAMNPCACGYYGDERCKCSDYEVIKYRGKISGPILDRIDIQKYVDPVNFMNLSQYKKGRTSDELKELVERACKIQQERYSQTKTVNNNSQMTPAMINEYCKLDDQSKKILQLAFEKFKFSARTYHKFLRVARTFADLEGAKNIQKTHIMKALMCRDLEKEQLNMMIV